MTPKKHLGPCLICGAPATDGHHIIPRGHIGGRAAENWPVNIAPLCHRCHMRIHAEGLRRTLERAGIPVGEGEYDALWELWSRMEYTADELAVLAALGWHRKASMYPLVIVRGNWAGTRLEKISEETRALCHRAGAENDWEPLLKLIAGPVPGWTGVE